MVDGLFFYATLKGRRGGHNPFVQAGVETSDTSAEAVNPYPGSSWDGHSGDGSRCRGWKCGVLWGCLPTPHSTVDPPSAPHVCCCCHLNWWAFVRWVTNECLDLRVIYTEELPGIAAYDFCLFYCAQELPCRAVHERRITRRNKTNNESCAATPGNSSV